ncbi:terpene synthase-like [Tenebrio molitor]|uniref:terpene synthase-like n=1 Tax=Tenebrio molitor TaxID=7067 RepID=UPI0036247840
MRKSVGFSSLTVVHPMTMENYYSKDNDREEDKMLLEPLLNFYQIGHARAKYAAKIAWCFNHWLKVPEEKVNKMISLIEPLYDSFMMIDDIYDDSVTRGGIPVMHSIYGFAHTINSINYTMANCIEKMLDMEEPRIIDIYIELGLDMHGGNGMEIYWRNNSICPTEKEYLDVIVPKTSSAVLLGVRVLQLYSDFSENLDRLAILLGQIFQLWNDFVNLKSDKQAQAKGYCQDISEGKFNFPIIHAIQTHPNDDQIMNILKQRTTNNELKKYCVSLMEEYGSFDYTLQTLDRLRNEAFEEIERLGGNPYIDHLIEYFFDKIEIS